MVKHEGNLYYTACIGEKCNKKVVADEQTGKWYCPACGKHYDTYNLRFVDLIIYPEPFSSYILSFAAADHSGSAWFNSFDDTGHLILSISANELAGLPENSAVWRIHHCFHQIRNEPLFSLKLNSSPTFSKSERKRKNTTKPGNLDAALSVPIL